MQFTFANIFIFQPELFLDLLVGVPDRAGFLKSIDSFLYIVVAKMIQQSHKISPRCCSIKRMKGIAKHCREQKYSKQELKRERERQDRQVSRQAGRQTDILLPHLQQMLLEAHRPVNPCSLQYLKHSLYVKRKLNVLKGTMI